MTSHLLVTVLSRRQPTVIMVKVAWPTSFIIFRRWCSRLSGNISLPGHFIRLLMPRSSTYRYVGSLEMQITLCCTISVMLFVVCGVKQAIFDPGVWFDVFIITCHPNAPNHTLKFRLFGISNMVTKPKITLIQPIDLKCWQRYDLV